MDRVLRLGVLPTFGSRWLMPRLASFTHEYDDIELHLVRGLSRSDFARLRVDAAIECSPEAPSRSEEHTSELQSLMRISYAVFCLKKKQQHNRHVHLSSHHK